MTIEEQNKEVVRRWNEDIVSEKKLELFDEVLAEDYKHYSSGRNRDEMKQRFAEIFKQYPAFKTKVEDMIAEGDKVAVRVTYYREGREPLSGIVFHRLVNGKIVDDWLGIQQTSEEDA